MQRQSMFIRNSKDSVAQWSVLSLFMAFRIASGATHADPEDRSLDARLTIAEDPSGNIATFKVDGPIDRSNPFFQSLGSNGRSCATCHVAAQAMSFTPEHARRLYRETRGTDPLFASVDGANCDTVAPEDRGGHSLLLQKGLIRVSLPVPPNAEYSISVVKDPYGCALRIDPKTALLTASVYRRPLPSANLSFLSAVMFDGRETLAPLTDLSTATASLRSDLSHQVIDATTGHAQAATPPTATQIRDIVDFELALFTAQYRDEDAGRLDAGGGLGGPLNLSVQVYYPGINDSLGHDPAGYPFTPASMQLFAAWAPASSNIDDRDGSARADIAAGEKLFNSAAMTISNVRGLNDSPALGRPSSFTGNCATCHDAPNIGNHSLPLPLDIGTSHIAGSGLESDPTLAAALKELNPADLPVFLISGCPDPFSSGTPASFYTTDPGRALITGRCSDFNRLKGPVLRGLAARAPYFHNGAAESLNEAVRFYNVRFQMGLTQTEMRQLVAFLRTL